MQSTCFKRWPRLGRLAGPTRAFQPAAMMGHGRKPKIQNKRVFEALAAYRGLRGHMCGPLPPGPLNPPKDTLRGVSVDMAQRKSEVERGALASAFSR